MSLNKFKVIIRRTINTDKFWNTANYRQRFEPISCMFRPSSNADISTDVVKYKNLYAVFMYKKGKVIPLQARCGPEGG